MKYTARLLAAALVCAAACSQVPPDGASDLAQTGRDAGLGGVVVNEVFPHGPDELTAPDWAELKNTGDSEVDLSGYRVRDDKTSAELPAGTRLSPGAYLVIYCDDVPDGAATDTLHVPFKLGGGDEFRLLKADGTTVDSVAWQSGVVPAGKAYGRLPDGTGPFAPTNPTRGARNQ